MKKIKLKLTPIDQRAKKSKEILVEGGLSLYHLAETIVNKFNIDFGHCFGFFRDTQSDRYLFCDEKYELFTDLIEEGQDLEPTGALSVKKTKVSNVWKKEGDKMMFLFDYGENLEWIVECLSVE
jgi:hypothetical protein